jgi:hypothetical protein
MTDHRVVRLTQGSERERIGCRAVEDEERFAVGLEQVTQTVTDPLGPGVVAIRGFVAAVVGGNQRIERFGTDARVVVGREMLLKR